MDWDYSFFMPKNNPFRRQKSDPNQSEGSMIVNEVNRVIPCTDCGRRVGDVSSMLFEIEQRVYCSSCGIKQINANTLKTH